MAIDSSLWIADIPAGTYNVGDVVELNCIDGPANVRSGYKGAVLKNIFVAQALSAPAVYWKIHVRNSDWIDDVQSIAASFTASTAFDERSGLNQRGHDCPLYPNSSWQVYAECVIGGTITTQVDSLFVLIDVDYTSVSAVQDPAKAVGFPTSIEDDRTLQSVAPGSALNATWDSRSLDYFKAGYRYVLDSVEITAPVIAYGFVAFSNAAGMGGLQRILPVCTYPFSIRYPVRYSSALEKGSMEVKYKMFEGTAQTIQMSAVHDYVKRVG